MLTTTEIQQFHRDGFTVARQVISAQHLAELRRTADEMLQQSAAIEKNNAVFELEPDHNRNRPRLARVNHPVAQQPIFWQIASSVPVLDCVAALIGDNIKFHHSKLNMKTSRGGSKIGWHQDFAFFPHTNFDLLACGIALDDSTTANGCLLCVPGTHRIGLLNHRGPDDDFMGQITSDANRFDPAKAVPVEMKAGDMSIHHAMVIHGSLQNTSEAQRRLLIFQYAAGDAIQLDRRPPANEFSERIVRGLTPTHARLAGTFSLRLRGEVGAASSIFERQRFAPLQA